MKKKTIALMGFSVLAALALVGCKDSNKDDKKTTTTTEEGGNTTTTGEGGNTTTTGEGGNTTTTGPVTYDEFDAATDNGAVGDRGDSSGSGSSGSYDYVSVDYTQDTKGLDLSVNYNATEGITLLVDSYNNTLETKTYQKGELLPAWKAFATNTKTTIREASDYSGNSNDNDYSNMKTAQFKSVKDTSQYVDLFYNSTGNIKDMVTNGTAQDLTSYINDGLMPNFKSFLDNNQIIADAIKLNGKYYYTPYFDGYNYIERQLVVDSTLAYNVLDQESFDLFDTTVAGKGAENNQLKENEYEPFIYGQTTDGTKVNYLGDKTVAVSKNATKTTITVKGNVENIISQQNKLLSAGTTGKALAQQLRTYLDDVYGDNIGADKTYKTYTDIFCSESAAYTSDELIALMRVIKANPGVISGIFDENGQLTAAGDSNVEVEVLVPRGAEKSRIQNILMFAEIWGIQGLDGEKDNLYFDASGTISDARATKQSYEALQYLHQLYDEGLIVGDFWMTASNMDKNYYVDKYIGKKANEGGYGFMLFDYSATQGQQNSKDSNGIGVDDSKRVGSFKDTKVGQTYSNGYTVGVMPIVAPLTYWANKGTAAVNYQSSITDRSNKTLMRYYDSNRALKSNSWVIPKTSDNKEVAARLMDYMFSETGSKIQDFGPESYWDGTETFKGKTNPKLSAAALNMVANRAGGDCFSYWRGYVGSSHGIGHIRSDYLNYVFMHEITRVGDKNVGNAIASGVLGLATLVDNPVWGSSVPTAGYGSTSSEDHSFNAVTSFWAADKAATTANGWVAIVKNGTQVTDAQTQIGTGTLTKQPYTYKDVYDQAFTKELTNYVYNILNVDEPDLAQYIPSYIAGLIIA